MSSRGCGYCGESIVAARSDARFCGAKCRVYSARRSARAPIIPAELRARDRFVRFAKNKRPIMVAGFGDASASSTNPATWASYQDALASSKGAGLGFVLNGDGIGVIDLDHCIDNGVVASWALDIMDANAGTFMEISTSGTGIHIWGLLTSQPGRVIRDGRNIEVYTTGRYVALGTPLDGSRGVLNSLVTTLAN